MNNSCVYSYRDPREELPFYIGKGKKDRPNKHLLPSRRYERGGHFYNKLNKLLDIEHLNPIIKIIVSDLSTDDASDVEIFLIKQYGRLDIGTGCLCNHTNGGEGTPGFSNPCSEETRLKLSRPHTQEKSLEHRINQSKPRSQEAKRNMQIAARRLCTPIESYDLKTGITIKKYESQSAVKVDGYSQAGVNKVLRGVCKYHGWYGWRYTVSCPSV